MTKQDNSKPQASVDQLDAAAPSQALSQTIGQAAGPAPMPGPIAGPSSGPGMSSTGQVNDAPREHRSRDGLIVVSILIVSAAITMMCISQLGLSMPISVATGIVALSLLMLIHKQVQKSA